jgi:DNA-binding MarR family transcriptional regulator
MEAAGFVAFEPSQTDRRCKAIRLTKPGLDAIEQIGRYIQQTENKLVEGMTDLEAAEFRRLLQIAAHNLGVCSPRFPKQQKEESDL